MNLQIEHLFLAIDFVYQPKLTSTYLKQLQVLLTFFKHCIFNSTIAMNDYYSNSAF